MQVHNAERGRGRSLAAKVIGNVKADLDEARNCAERLAQVSDQHRRRPFSDPEQPGTRTF